MPAPDFFSGNCHGQEKIKNKAHREQTLHILPTYLQAGGKRRCRQMPSLLSL